MMYDDMKLAVMGRRSRVKYAPIGRAVWIRWRRRRPQGGLDRV